MSERMDFIKRRRQWLMRGVWTHLMFFRREHKVSSAVIEWLSSIAEVKRRARYRDRVSVGAVDEPRG